MQLHHRFIAKFSNAPKFEIDSIQQRVNLSGGETDNGIDFQRELSSCRYIFRR